MAAEEEAPEFVTATQALLQPLIKKPKLSAKLLGKPPFRFLHDIVSELTKATGFAQGLYDPDELDSATFKDKEKKINYLNKIIKLASIANNRTINVRPTKVVAGLEPENTNALLQALAHAANSGVDNDACVREALTALAEDEARKPAPPTGEPDRPSWQQAAMMANSAFPAGIAGVAAQALEAASVPGLQPQTSAPSTSNGGETLSMNVTAAVPTKRPEEELASSVESRAPRQRTARKAPPKVASNEVKVEKRSGRTAAAVIIEDADGMDEDDDTIQMVDQAGEALSVSSLNITHESAGAGKLVQNLMEAKVELESVAGSGAGPDGSDGGIILGKKGTEKSGGTSLDVPQLRASVQKICQSANLLGRCLEYVHEDMEDMGKEYEQYRTISKAKLIELAEEEATTEASLRDLQMEMAKLDAEMEEKLSHIRFYKAMIVQNDKQIEKLLMQVVKRG